jgi:hypothetical protein
VHTGWIDPYGYIHFCRRFVTPWGLFVTREAAHSSAKDKEMMFYGRKHLRRRSPRPGRHRRRDARRLSRPVWLRPRLPDFR